MAGHQSGLKRQPIPDRDADWKKKRVRSISEIRRHPFPSRRTLGGPTNSPMRLRRGPGFEQVLR